MNIGPFTLVASIVGRLRPSRRQADLDLLQRWADQTIEPGEADTLEARLFFDRRLLQQAHRLQRQTLTGLLATLLLVVVALPTDSAAASGAEPADSAVTVSGDTLADRLLQRLLMLFGIGDDDDDEPVQVLGDPGGSADPETGTD